MDFIRRKRKNLIPILTNFRKINLFEKTLSAGQCDVDATDGQEWSTLDKSVKRRGLKIKEISLNFRQEETGDLTNKARVNLAKAKKEIEKFENDFVFPALKDLQSDEDFFIASSKTVLCADNDVRICYSSSQSDSDSGISSRSSSADTDSRHSAGSGYIRQITNDEDENINNVQNKEDSQPQMISKHKLKKCECTVTVNGICYSCI